MEYPVFKPYTIQYQFKHRTFGFSNEITITTTSEEVAIEEAKKAVSEVYGERMLKNFSFKLKNPNI